MRVVAVGAGDLVMHRQAAVRRRVEWPVAACAVPGAVGLCVELEGVAGEALGDLPLVIEVRVGGLLDMAVGADADIDFFEVFSGRIVAVVALQRMVHHVLRVTR